MSGTQHQNPEGTGRRLAAIVFTDVAGYSARMQQDEISTLALVRADFERMRTLCAQHGGEVLKSTGDGLLFCFGSVVQATACALQIQAEFGRRVTNALQHRIGIHLGDMFREGGDVVGDGVNIAARLQTKARPGTICVSQSVYDAVKGKLPMQAEPLGPQQFKNIAELVSVYLIVAQGAVKPAAKIRRAKWPVAVALAVAITSLAVIYWPKPAPVTAVVKDDKSALADKSIAVLPFTNMSDDKENAYFADGVHEDILTNLAHIAELKVISRTSVMQYRDSKKPLGQIAAELHVAYVLEGSVRRVGNVVRVTGQLIRAGTDEHVWAQAYDRELKDIFSIQTALAVEIAGALQAAISPAQKNLLARQPTRVPAAYDLFLRARGLLNTSDWDKLQENRKRAESLLRSAVELDPDFAVAWSYLADVHGQIHFFDADRTPERQALARAAIDQAVRLAPDDPEVIRNRGACFYHAFRDYPRAEEQYRRVLSLQPNDGEAHYLLGLLVRREGKWSEALDEFRRAAELEQGNFQFQSTLPFYLAYVAHRYEEAERLIIPLVQRENDSLGEFRLDACELAFWARGSTKELSDHLAAIPADLRQRPAYANALRDLAKNRGDWAELARLDALQTKPWANYLDAATTLAALGRLDEARQVLASHPEDLHARLRLQPSNQGLHYELARVEALLGHQTEARQAAHEMLALLPVGGDTTDEPGMRATLGFVLLWTGDKEAALKELAWVLQQPHGLNVHDLRTSADYAPLHGDARFEALLNDPKNNAPRF